MIEKDKAKNIKYFVILISLSFVLIGFDKLGWLSFIKRPFEGFGSPLIKWFYSKKINLLKKAKVEGLDMVELQEEVGKLSRENADLKNKLAELEKENASLNKLLGAPLPPDWQFIPAHVLSSDEGVITIDQGSDIGIRLDQVVIFENVLVGQVIKVNPRLSKVKLVNYKDFQVKVKVVESGVKGVVLSQVANLLLLDQVLQEEVLEKDQLVVTSGEDEVFPAGLLIGRIEKIEKEETAVYQTAVLKPLVDYKTLETVFLIR